jgi:hypothetical protein
MKSGYLWQEGQGGQIAARLAREGFLAARSGLKEWI